MIRLLIVGFLCLLLGAGIGWYAGYVHPNVKADRDARKFLQSMELDDRGAASIAVGTIPLIEAQRNEQAAEKLAKVAGSYYRVYSKQDTGDSVQMQERKVLLGRIEDLAKRYPNLSNALHNGYAVQRPLTTDHHQPANLCATSNLTGTWSVA